MTEGIATNRIFRTRMDAHFWISRQRAQNGINNGPDEYVIRRIPQEEIEARIEDMHDGGA